MRRYDCLAVLAPLITDELCVTNVARSGFEWHAACPREGNLYTMAMGMVTPVCLGLALALPRRRVIAIDGDGSLLLNLGALTTVANAAPPNLIVLVFDNRSYASTGGLPTATAGATDLAAMAAGAGIRGACTVNSVDAFHTALQDAWDGGGPWVIVARVTGETAAGRSQADGWPREQVPLRALRGRERRRDDPQALDRGAARLMNAAMAELIADGLREAGFNFVASLPATQLHALQERLGRDPGFVHVGVANEGEGGGSAPGRGSAGGCR